MHEADGNIRPRGMAAMMEETPAIQNPAYRPAGAPKIRCGGQLARFAALPVLTYWFSAPPLSGKPLAGTPMYAPLRCSQIARI